MKILCQLSSTFWPTLATGWALGCAKAQIRFWGWDAGAGSLRGLSVSTQGLARSPRGWCILVQLPWVETLSVSCVLQARVPSGGPCNHDLSLRQLPPTQPQFPHLEPGL